MDTQCCLVARSREGIEEFAKDERTAVTYYWDSHGVLGRQLNSFFKPRLYLLDRSRLLYVQPPQSKPDQAIGDIARILQKGDKR
jgi:hypothetical protein